jgi:hypothetical protein
MEYKAIVTRDPNLITCLAVWAARRIHGQLPVEFVHPSFAKPVHNKLYVDLACGLHKFETFDGDFVSAGVYLLPTGDGVGFDKYRKLAEYVNEVDHGKEIKAGSEKNFELGRLMQIASFAVVSNEAIISIMGDVFETIVEKRLDVENLSLKTVFEGNGARQKAFARSFEIIAAGIASRRIIGGQMKREFDYHKSKCTAYNIKDGNHAGTDLFWSDQEEMWCFVNYEPLKPTVMLVEEFIIVCSQNEFSDEIIDKCLACDLDGKGYLWLDKNEFSDEELEARYLDVVYDSEDI